MAKAIIFDLDGLLIDSEPFWRRGHMAIVAKHGGEVTEEEVRAVAGIPTQTQAKNWVDRFGFETDYQELGQQITEFVIDRIKTEVEALPGAVELVKKLYEQKVPIAIATSAEQDVIDAVCGRLGFDKYIPIIHSATNEKRGKPFPDVFLTTARMLNVDPADCVVFEDSVNGIKAAKAAGMYCVAVPEKPYEKEKFEIADKIIDSLEGFSLDSLQTF